VASSPGLPPRRPPEGDHDVSAPTPVSRPRRGHPVRPRHQRAPANQVRDDDLPLGARIADKVTAVFGSWAFILTQTALIALWPGYNGYAAASTTSSATTPD
jgi:hypothetical protein